MEMYSFHKQNHTETNNPVFKHHRLTNIQARALTTSEFSRERCSMEVAPEIWARAAARALTGPFSRIRN